MRSGMLAAVLGAILMAPTFGVTGCANGSASASGSAPEVSTPGVGAAVVDAVCSMPTLLGPYSSDGASSEGDDGTYVPGTDDSGSSGDDGSGDTGDDGGGSAGDDNGGSAGDDGSDDSGDDGDDDSDLARHHRSRKAAEAAVVRSISVSEAPVNGCYSCTVACTFLTATGAVVQGEAGRGESTTSYDGACSAAQNADADLATAQGEKLGTCRISS